MWYGDAQSGIDATARPANASSRLPRAPALIMRSLILPALFLPALILPALILAALILP